MAASFKIGSSGITVDFLFALQQLLILPLLLLLLLLLLVIVVVVVVVVVVVHLQSGLPIKMNKFHKQVPR